MKNILFNTLTLLCVSLFSFNINAQTSAETDVLKMWDDVWKAYETDDAKMWSFYAENACEVYPDGNAACGLKTIKEGYEQFKNMIEGKPTWTSAKPSVRFITPDVALLLSDVTSDIKLKGGQQIGGKSKFAAVVHKVNGKWIIEFDSQTPLMQMPGTGN
jgi:uncharacterized protein (TIGR02246 family)